MDYNQPMPSSFVPFCLIMCFVYSFFSLNHFMYLVMFMFYTIFIFRFSLKKSNINFMLRIWSILERTAYFCYLGLNRAHYLFLLLWFHGLDILWALCSFFHEETFMESNFTKSRNYLFYFFHHLGNLHFRLLQ